jgi:hypothetical protein
MSSMNVDRFKLHGTYRTPQFRYGQKVKCEVRGEMIISGFSDAPIPWPTGRQIGRGGPALLVVFKGLARAQRRESRNTELVGAAGGGEFRGRTGPYAMIELLGRLKRGSS